VFEPFADGRMVVKEKLDQRRWLDVGQILVGQASHRDLEGPNHLCSLQRVLVGLVLDGAAQTIADGHDHQTKDSGHQEQEGHGGRIGQSQVVVLGVNCPVESQVDQVQPAKRQYRLADNKLPEIVMDMVSQFMGQHNLDLVGRVAIEHRVTKHDTAGVAQTH